MATQACLNNINVCLETQQFSLVLVTLKEESRERERERSRLVTREIMQDIEYNFHVVFTEEVTRA